jgi:hypothetical protein
VSQSFIANGNLTGSYAKWSLTWLFGYAHDLGQPTTKMVTVTLAVSQMREESNPFDSLDQPTGMTPRSMAELR